MLSLVLGGLALVALVAAVRGGGAEADVPAAFAVSRCESPSAGCAWVFVLFVDLSAFETGQVLYEVTRAMATDFAGQASLALFHAPAADCEETPEVWACVAARTVACAGELAPAQVTALAGAALDLRWEAEDARNYVRLRARAAALGVDVAGLDACVAARETALRVKRQRELAMALGLGEQRVGGWLIDRGGAAAQAPFGAQVTADLLRRMGSCMRAERCAEVGVAAADPGGVR